MGSGVTPVCSLLWLQLRVRRPVYSRPRCMSVEGFKGRIHSLLSVHWIKVSRYVNCTQEWVRASPRDGHTVQWLSYATYSACGRCGRWMRSAGWDLAGPVCTFPEALTTRPALQQQTWRLREVRVTKPWNFPGRSHAQLGKMKEHWGSVKSPRGRFAICVYFTRTTWQLGDRVSFFSKPPSLQLETGLIMCVSGSGLAVMCFSKRTVTW